MAAEGDEMDLSIGTFSGMPGVRRKSLKGPIVDAVPNQFMTALRKYRTASAAGDHGSVMVYVDDAKQFRCQFHRWTVVHESQSFKFKTQVKAWLTEWLPRMSDPQ